MWTSARSRRSVLGAGGSRTSWRSLSADLAGAGLAALAHQVVETLAELLHAGLVDRVAIFIRSLGLRMHRSALAVGDRISRRVEARVDRAPNRLACAVETLENALESAADTLAEAGRVSPLAVRPRTCRLRRKTLCAFDD